MAKNVFGFEGSYAKVKEDVKNDLTINSKEFLYQMKYLAKIVKVYQVIILNNIIKK